MPVNNIARAAILREFVKAHLVQCDCGKRATKIYGTAAVCVDCFGDFKISWSDENNPKKQRERSREYRRRVRTERRRKECCAACGNPSKRYRCDTCRESNRIQEQLRREKRRKQPTIYGVAA